MQMTEIQHKFTKAGERIYLAGKCSTGYRGLGDDFTLHPLSSLTDLLHTTHVFVASTLWFSEISI